MVIREQITIQAFINHNMLRLLFYNTALLCYLDNIAIFMMIPRVCASSMCLVAHPPTALTCSMRRSEAAAVYASVLSGVLRLNR